MIKFNFISLVLGIIVIGIILVINGPETQTVLKDKMHWIWNMAKEKPSIRIYSSLVLRREQTLKIRRRVLVSKLYNTWKANKDQLTGQAKGKLSGLKSGKKTGLSTERDIVFFHSSYHIGSGKP